MIYVNAVDSLVMISRYKTSRTNVPKRTLTVSVVEAMKLTNVKFTEQRHQQFCVYKCMNVWLLESITIYTLYYHWSLITCFVLTKGLPEILTRNCNKDFKFVNRQICSYNYNSTSDHTERSWEEGKTHPSLFSLLLFFPISSLPLCIKHLNPSSLVTTQYTENCIQKQQQQQL